jgi:hypothetical protein
MKTSISLRHFMLFTALLTFGISTKAQVNLPADTQLSIVTDRAIASGSVQPGFQFAGIIDLDVLVDNQIAIAKGTQVMGKVLSVTTAGRAVGKAEIILELTKIKQGDKYVDIKTHPLKVAPSEGQGAKTARRVAVGAAAGAVFDGGKGAGRGAAAMGAASLLGRDGNITIPKGYNLPFHLAESLTY